LVDGGVRIGSERINFQKIRNIFFLHPDGNQIELAEAPQKALEISEPWLDPSEPPHLYQRKVYTARTAKNQPRPGRSETGLVRFPNVCARLAIRRAAGHRLAEAVQSRRPLRSLLRRATTRRVRKRHQSVRNIQR
jgi:hypothetical protein